MSRATWKALSHTFEHLAESLERHGRFIRTYGSTLRNFQADLDQDDDLMCVDSGLDATRNWSDVKMEFYRYRNDLNRSREIFAEEEEKRKEEQKTSVMTWISASKKTQLLHKKFQDMRICRDTGRWLFRRYSEITDWIKEDQPSESAMWLHGSKGFGNSIRTTKDYLN
jgi:hypothetical protein